MKFSYFPDTLHKPFLFFVLLFSHQFLIAQGFEQVHYPQGYFIYPVEAKIGLAANFGELRPNHYHMGLDCRTDQVVNKKVVAAAEGYVARVSIAAGGFGRAIYINHPNGLTTLYGHLNNFFPALEQYLKDRQYQLSSWQVYLDIPANLFPVKQGQFIAYSGNTGGSQGPHCHFEIRDTRTEKVLNPLLFGLLLPDNVPPRITRLYMYDRCLSTYSQSPLAIGIKKLGNDYTSTQPVITIHTDKVSFGISTFDQLSGSANPNGIYEGVIYLDDIAQCGFRLDSIGYNETRYMNAHIDYKTKSAGGPYIEHLSRLPGYPEGVYRDFKNDGVIELKDDSTHEVKIVVSDTKGNESEINFKIKKGLIRETGEPEKSSVYYNAREFIPGFVNIFENENLQVLLTPRTLYDSVKFSWSQKKGTDLFSCSPVFSVLSGLVPAHDLFTIKIKTDKILTPFESDRMLMRRKWGSKTEVAKAVKEGDWFVARFRSFGDFELIADTIPPVINGLAANANLSRAGRIVLVPKDNNDDMKNFRAMLDGKWLRFTNDKGRAFIYDFDDRCGRGAHVLSVSIEDEAGNKGERVFNFVR